MNPSKTLSKNFSSHSRTILMCSLLAAAAAFGVLPIGTLSNPLLPAAQAQNFGQRTIQGKVVDDRGAEVGSATVFLKNLKSRSVKDRKSVV